ncbi:hypothetical protein [Bradyrhizobium sp. OK095]|jgi:hypothetical protein|uniref:hypothetical protein n=1 Tax=Bradyrhizobium sp. OK095 TaxID=1882760 RepID=UPI0008BB28A2|nr:hypothetical protein [Bradyrhizobium sp. OK095]SEM66224.1 hypothetical protein SAMN05443254_103143 [Bradyrhizobium sp. OK095]
MRRLTWIAASAFAALSSGCSIYPLPDDVMSFNSDKIAAIIRCQTRDAIRQVVIRNIEAAGSPILYEQMNKEQLLDWLRSNPESWRRLKWERFALELRNPFVFYKDTSISYDFTIDTTEQNTTGLNVTLLRQFTGSTNAIGLGAKNDRTREVSRHFRTFDTFDSLARLMRTDACENAPRAPNYLFPAAGLLRINSLVDSFLLANQWENLAGKDQDYTTASMSDTLTFTTKNTGNFDPSTTADPTIGKWVPTSASLNLDNLRQDLHTIIILISLPPDKKGLPQFDEFGRILAPGKAAKAAASAALDRQREFNTQNALTRFGTGVGRIVP